MVVVIIIGWQKSTKIATFFSFYTKRKKKKKIIISIFKWHKLKIKNQRNKTTTLILFIWSLIHFGSWLYCIGIHKMMEGKTKIIQKSNQIKSNQKSGHGTEKKFWCFFLKGQNYYIKRVGRKMYHNVFWVAFYFLRGDQKGGRKKIIIKMCFMFTLATRQNGGRIPPQNGGNSNVTSFFPVVVLSIEATLHKSLCTYDTQRMTTLFSTKMSAFFLGGVCFRNINPKLMYTPYP